MEIRWRARAQDELRRQLDYIRRRNFTAAEVMADRIDAAVSQLALFPHGGRPSRYPSVRELVVSRTPFVVVYRVRDGEVEVLRFFHARQNR